jgi:hypothetical protein
LNTHNGLCENRGHELVRLRRSQPRGPWWRRQSVGQKIATAVFWLIIAFGAFAVLAGVYRLIADTATMWQDGTLLDAIARQAQRYQIPLLVLAGIVALFLLWIVVAIAWAWITLPATLRAGVGAVERLRLEVVRLRSPGHRMISMMTSTMSRDADDAEELGLRQGTLRD